MIVAPQSRATCRPFIWSHGCMAGERCNITKYGITAANAVMIFMLACKTCPTWHDPCVMSCSFTHVRHEFDCSTHRTRGRTKGKHGCLPNDAPERAGTRVVFGETFANTFWRMAWSALTTASALNRENCLDVHSFVITLCVLTLFCGFA